MAQLKSTKVFGDLNVTGEVNVSTKITVKGKEIIERGSNANGEYVRYADGTQICSRLVLISTPDGAASTAIEATWTYPAVFILNPNVSSSGMARNGTDTIAGVSSGSASITTTAHTTRHVHSTTTLTDIWWDSRIAIGRWY